MKSSGQSPMKGKVDVDEFVLGSKEKSKQGRSKETKKSKIIVGIELTDKISKKKLKKGKSRHGIKRAYFKIIDDFSSKSFLQFFHENISLTANITADKWTGYIPLKTNFRIGQKDSANGIDFPEVHIIIHQVKTWIRTIFSGVSKKYLHSYLDKFSFRLNRSLYRKTIFHKLLERVVDFQMSNENLLKVSLIE